MGPHKSGSMLPPGSAATRPGRFTPSLTAQQGKLLFVSRSDRQVPRSAPTMVIVNSRTAFFSLRRAAIRPFAIALWVAVWAGSHANSQSPASLRQNCVRYGGQIVATARKYNLDSTLLAAMAAQQTGGPDQDSGRNVVQDDGNGYGLFQIDSTYHSSFTSTPNAMVPAFNTDYAGLILSNFFRKYGDIDDAVKAYNAGIPVCGSKTYWRSTGQHLCYLESVQKHQQDIMTHQQNTNNHC